jgi:hypothetical protein
MITLSQVQGVPRAAASWRTWPRMALKISPRWR